MAEFTQYTTIEGDRWDTVAYKAYGDPMLFPQIAEANRGIPLDVVFIAGVKLRVPILDAVSVDTNLLPPWKR
jgi:phage tail protein X